MNLILKILPIIFIFATTHSQTISLVTSNGCPPDTVIFQDCCIKKLPGCQIYKNEQECLKCDDKSSLQDGRCFMIMNIQDFLPLINLKPKLSSSKGVSNQNKFTYLDTKNFKNVKTIISSKYPLFTDVQTQPLIKNILRTSFETIFSFIWTNSKNKTQLFEFSVDYEGVVTELISDDYDPNLQNSLFGTINFKLMQKYGMQLLDSTLMKIAPVSKNLYKLHYYSDFGFHFVSFIQKIPFLEIKQLQTVQWKYDEPEMLNYIYSQHPFLVMQNSSDIKKRDNTKSIQYDVKFKSQTQLVLEQIPGQRQRIIFFHREENQTLPSNSKIVGGYQILRNKQDDILRKVLTHLFIQFTILKNTDISKIQYQIVAGTNYLIHLKDKTNNDEYICKVFYSLSGQINILEIYLNSVLIHTQPLAPLQIDLSYNYSTDQLFINVNDYIKSVKGLTIPDQIMYVNKVKKTNDVNIFYQFEIVYETNSYILASYFIDGPKYGTIELNDFISNGDNEFDQEAKIQETNQIKDYLQSYKQWLNPLAIEYLKETKPNEYLLKTITQYGSYFFKVIDTQVTGFQIYYYELIDQKQTCMTHSSDQLDQFQFDQKIFISSLLKSNQIDPNSQLVSFSQGILNSKTRYRLLFVNPSNSKKAQVFVRVQDRSGLGLFVDSIQDQNDGLYVITNQDFYSKAVEKAVLLNPDLLKDSKIIYGMMNKSNILLYFSKASTKQNVYLVTMDLGLSKSNITTYVQQQISKICKKFDDNGNCIDCKDNNVALMSVCYKQINNCMTQVGGNCLVCENEYSLLENACVNDCGMFM